MKRTRLFAAMLLAALLGAAPAAAQESDIVIERLSADDARMLEAMGDFFYDDRWGLVWKPADMDENWHPYADESENARPVYDARMGWVYESGEPWADITYRHGLWRYHDESGWVWNPNASSDEASAIEDDDIEEENDDVDYDDDQPDWT